MRGPVLAIPIDGSLPSMRHNRAATLEPFFLKTASDRQVTSGIRYSVTLFTPNHLERLSPVDWMNLESFGFPVDLYPERAVATLSAAKGPTSSELATEALSAQTPEPLIELRTEDQCICSCPR